MEDLPGWLATILGVATLSSVLFRWYNDRSALEMIKYSHEREISLLNQMLAAQETKTVRSVLEREEKYIEKISRLQKEFDTLENIINTTQLQSKYRSGSRVLEPSEIYESVSLSLGSLRGLVEEISSALEEGVEQNRV